MKALLRISPDITTKAPGTRARFTRALVSNLRQALGAEGIGARVTRDHVRVYLESDDARALEVACRVFGVHSASPCVEEKAGSLEELVERGLEINREAVSGRSFAVRSKVRGRHPFGSQRLNEALGAALSEHGHVDLSNPEITVEVEVREGWARWFTERRSGAAGLPIGVEGRAVALVSGGFDSAVAAWLALRRGTALDLVFCRLGGPAHERAVLPIANHLASRWGAGGRPRLYVVPFEPVAELIAHRVPEPMRQLALKQLMYQTAAAIARLVRAEGIVTGESLGQVSSQTLRNLRTLGSPERYPILRPVLTYTKEEIIGLARRIGTHDLSVGVPEYCALVPRRPATAASFQELRAAVESIGFNAREAAQLAERLDLPAEIPSDDPDEEVEEIPEGALVLDMRQAVADGDWTDPRAKPFDTERLGEQTRALDPKRLHVVVCQFGLRSGWLARHLRRQGYRAVSLRGGAGSRSHRDGAPNLDRGGGHG